MPLTDAALNLCSHVFTQLCISRHYSNCRTTPTHPDSRQGASIWPSGLPGWHGSPLPPRAGWESCAGHPSEDIPVLCGALLPCSLPHLTHRVPSGSPCGGSWQVGCLNSVVNSLASGRYRCNTPNSYQGYRKISNIRRTKSPNLIVPRLVLQFSLLNPMKPGVRSRMKM